jgi:hypothetical protein
MGFLKSIVKSVVVRPKPIPNIMSAKARGNIISVKKDAFKLGDLVSYCFYSEYFIVK